jgi:BTB/POZ domain
MLQHIQAGASVNDRALRYAKLQQSNSNSIHSSSSSGTANSSKANRVAPLQIAHDIYTKLLQHKCDIDVSDTELVLCDGTVLHCHKCILYAFSTYFRQLIDEHTNNYNCNKLQLSVTKYSADVMICLIHSMYNGQLIKPNDNSHNTSNGFTTGAYIL